MWEGNIMKEIVYKPIGVIHSPFKDIRGIPVQPAAAKGIAGTVEVEPAYIEGLRDIEGFSYIILIYHLHLSKGYKLQVVPFLDDCFHGVFSTRAPRRPNPIGISIVRLIKVEGGIIHIEDIDILDGTPLLDLKPYVPEFDKREKVKIGWLSKNVDKISKTKSDERFKE